MKATFTIKKLCESWWEKLADSTKDEHYRFAEQFLALLGWDDPAPLATVAASLQASTVSYLLRGAGHDAVAAHFVMPGLLDPPGSVIEKGLDFCETTRTLTDMTRAIGLRYVFITDLFRSSLYDSRTEELLLHCDVPADFEREFGHTLSRIDMERGALDEVRRQPRSYMARQLREWSQRWYEILGQHGRGAADAVSLAIDRLVVLRYLMEHDILKRPGWRLQKRFVDVLALAFSPNPDGCGKRLTGLYHDIWLDWKAGLFAPAPAVDAVIEEDMLAVPLLREFVMLSRSKFSIGAILESFNYGDADEKGRVRMIPEESEDRSAYLAKQTPATADSVQIELDLKKEGYRSVLHWFDRLVTLYERLAIEFDNRNTPNETVSGELDLFAWSALDAARPRALADRFQHAVEQGLAVYYSSPRQFRTARLMLYLHLISRYEQARIRFIQFPDIESALKPRPTLLESDRVLIFNPPPVEEEWG